MHPHIYVCIYTHKYTCTQHNQKAFEGTHSTILPYHIASDVATHTKHKQQYYTIYTYIHICIDIEITQKQNPHAHLSKHKNTKQ